MSQFIERKLELEDGDISSFVSQGYLEAYDEEMSESYLYDPKHWVLANEGTYNYMFDNLYFKSLTDEAYVLAKSEGYGTFKTQSSFIK